MLEVNNLAGGSGYGYGGRQAVRTSQIWFEDRDVAPVNMLLKLERRVERLYGKLNKTTDAYRTKNETEAMEGMNADSNNCSIAFDFS